jgi:hypothetical protein
MTIDFLIARCTGDMAKAVSLLEQRFQAYPRSRSGKTHFAFVLQHTNKPRAAQEILNLLQPERDMGWLVSPEEAQPRYWKYVAASWHTLQEYSNELAITDGWRDSTDMEWQVIRARALAALGKESDALALLNLMLAGSMESEAEPILTMAAELAAHGHPRAARTVAESLLVRLEIEPVIDSRRAASIATANRLLGRANSERQALERVVQDDADTLALLQAEARIAVLIDDTARAERVDSLLREMSGRPLRSPWARGGQILTRAHIAVGFERRERAVALLREATTRGLVFFGAAHAFHADPLLAPLRGYPPFVAMLRPED